MAASRVRLDELVFDRGLVDSRNEARGLIMAGLVLVDGTMVDKAGTAVSRDAELTVKSTRRYASRAGEKLAGALDFFGMTVAGRNAVDVGASTGGFVDCLLQRGASRVIALDVGRGQLDMRLRSDSRVHVLEGINARYLESADLPFEPDLMTMDVSFISVRKVLPAVTRCMASCFDAVVLAKPQFEAGRDKVGKKGVVRDPAVHRDIVLDVALYAAEQLELDVLGVCRSGLPGVGGNVEFFLHLARGREKGFSLDRLRAVVEDCVG